MRHFVAADINAFGDQFGVNPGAAIDALAGLVDPLDVGQQVTIALRPCALRTLAPGVVATG